MWGSATAADPQSLVGFVYYVRPELTKQKLKTFQVKVGAFARATSIYLSIYFFGWVSGLRAWPRTHHYSLPNLYPLTHDAELDLVAPGRGGGHLALVEALVAAPDLEQRQETQPMSLALNLVTGCSKVFFLSLS